VVFSPSHPVSLVFTGQDKVGNRGPMGQEYGSAMPIHRPDGWNPTGWRELRFSPTGRTPFPSGLSDSMVEAAILPRDLVLQSMNRLHPLGEEADSEDRSHWIGGSRRQFCSSEWSHRHRASSPSPCLARLKERFFGSNPDTRRLFSAGLSSERLKERRLARRVSFLAKS
jgi:hypothetical protein